MYNTKFTMDSGKDLYPGYLNREQRTLLRDKYKGKKEYMWCGCRPDARLYYKISEDLRIYPEHNGYTHDRYCCRYKDLAGSEQKKPPYYVGEDGEVTVFTSFDPKRFSRNVDNSENNQQYVVAPDEELEESDEILIDKDNQEKPAKELQLGLDGLIRGINVDCFTEKVLNDKMVGNRQNFSAYVYHRTKKVKLSRNKKTIGELTLEKDGVRFMYVPFAGIYQSKDQNFSRTYMQTIGADKKVFKNFTFPEIAEKAVTKFRKQYGIEPDANTVLAGFQYIKKNKSNNNTYRVLGRIHLFQVSDVGVYCRSITELNVFNALHRITKKNSVVKFWIPPEDVSVGAIIEIDGYHKKILLLFRSKSSEKISYNPDLYVPLVVDSSTIITEQRLYQLMQ
ncbi:MAG: hypothetical protein K2P35_08435 [Lachnospiraceae bacterium]|nr:hypothetical protein [Lachnospiraceae bacterium]